MILVAFVFGTLGHLAGTVVGFFAPSVLDEYAGHPFVLLLVGPACAIIGCVRGATWLGRRGLAGTGCPCPSE